MAEGLIDFGAGAILPFDRITEDWLALIAEDADALDSQPAVARLRDMVARGTSADVQRAVAARARAAGATEDEALRAVTRHLIEEFRQDL